MFHRDRQKMQIRTIRQVGNTEYYLGMKPGNLDAIWEKNSCAPLFDAHDLSKRDYQLPSLLHY